MNQVCIDYRCVDQMAEKGLVPLHALPTDSVGSGQLIGGVDAGLTHVVVDHNDGLGLDLPWTPRGNIDGPGILVKGRKQRHLFLIHPR